MIMKGHFHTAKMPALPEGSRGLQLNPKARPTTTKMKQVIGQVLANKLENAVYQSERAAALTKEIADAIKMRLKECDFPRFKYVVQVVIGEQRGEGVRMGCRCFWDAETDCYASETFSNVSIVHSS